MSVILARFLPTEITNIILEYTGYHKCRSGQYMRQIICTSRKYRIFKILFDKIIRSRSQYQSFAVLKLSPITKYIVFNSYAANNGRL
jgi:hypothetical protein